MKPCNRCKQVKPLSEYPKHPTCLDGHSNTCKPCRKIESKESYQKNKEAYKDRAKKWAENNRQKRREIVNRSYEKHREKKNAKSRAYNKRIRQENPEKERIKGIHYQHIRRARLLSVERTATAKEIKVVKDRAGGICVYCGREAELLTIDHFTPITKGGNHSVENLIPCCKPCNSSKNAAIGEEWIYKKHGVEGLARSLMFLEGNDFKQILPA
jgi:5-methylcytosine-specific restriction endonuclease McrA